MAKRQEKLTVIRLCVILGILVWIPTISRMLVGIDEPPAESPPPAKSSPPLDVQPVSHRTESGPAGLASAPETLRLSATYVSGDRRSAVINGKRLEAGGTIRTEAGVFQVQKIESGRVELASGARRYELKLEDDEWGRWVPFPMDETR